MADSYYTVIRGKKYDRRMLELAEGLTSGRGDGRISIADAKNLLRVVKDSNNYSATEKLTMEYIRKHYKFTKEGDEFFRNEIRKWAAKKTTTKKSKPVKETKATAKVLPPAAEVAPQQPQQTREALPVQPTQNTANKSSAIRQILFGLLVLIAAAVLFYFIAYKSSCAKPPVNPLEPNSPVTAEPAPSQPAAAATAPAETQKPVAAAPSAAFNDYVQKIRLGFVAEKTELTPETLKALDELAEKMKTENANLRVTGHTCSLGPKSLNQLISEKRAQLVKAALVARGIAADRIETRGLADSEPAGDNKTVFGRALNRRVTFNVIQK